MLTQSRINQIEARVREVLTTLDTNPHNITPPISFDRVLHAFQIKLKAGDFKNQDISGAYDKKQKIIFIAEHDLYQRKAFTIAHELGHFFLHQDKQTEIFYRQQVISMDKEKIQEEQEANWFAASFLMPEKPMQQYWMLTGDPDQLAVIFGVSTTAVNYRLKNLHLI